MAVADDRVVGFIHLTYARQFAGAPRARVECLVAHGVQAQAAGKLLLELAVRRARNRGCSAVLWVQPEGDSAARGLVEAGGWRPCGDVVYLDLLDGQGPGDG